MNATAANLIERVLPPQSGLRQWVLTFPFSWRRHLAQDGALLGRLTRIAVETVLAFYAARAAQEGGLGAKSGAVTAIQRTSSDPRLNPHLHMIVLDGTWSEDGELAWEGLWQLGTRDVGEVLERLVRRMERHLRRSGQHRTIEDEAEEGDPEGNLAACAVSGQAPPAGPQWVSRLAPLEPQALAYDKPLCASLDGFRLHAATRAGALDSAGREALLRYVLRPPIAQERVEQRRRSGAHHAEKAYNAGTIAVDMDPLSLLCRLATSVPPPWLHTIRYAGVLAPARPWRGQLAPQSPPQATAASDEPGRPDHAGGYRPWAELLARTFAVDVLVCPTCQGRMKLLALVKRPASISRYLAAAGAAAELPRRSPGRGPPYWKSRVLRLKVLGEEDEAGGRGSEAGEVA